jgi:hypothetical protein
MTSLKRSRLTKRMLLEAIAQCDRRQITPMSDLLDELRSRA